MRGRRPTATRSSSPRSSSPPSRCSETWPPSPREAPTALTPVVISTPDSLERRRDLLAGEGLLVDQDPLRGLDQGDARAQARPCLRHLDADDAAAEDQQPLRNLLRGRRLPVRPRRRLGEALDRRHSGGGAAGDHDRLSRLQRVGARRHRALARELAAGAKQGDPARLEPGKLAGVVEIVNDLVAAREHELRVELSRDHLAHSCRARDLGQQLAGAQQRLRGHAGVVGALAADQMLLDHGDLEAVLGSAAGEDLAGGTGADHDHVEFSFAHRAVTSLSARPLRSCAQKSAIRRRRSPSRGRSRRRPPRAARRDRGRRPRRARACAAGSRGTPSTRACFGP